MALSKNSVSSLEGLMTSLESSVTSFYHYKLTGSLQTNITNIGVNLCMFQSNGVGRLLRVVRCLDRDV